MVDTRRPQPIRRPVALPLSPSPHAAGASRRRRWALGLLAAWLLVGLAGPAWGYIVYLKDGSQINTKDKYRIEGDKAYLTMPNGTETTIAAAEIDVAKTEEVNQTNYGGRTRVIEGGQVVQIGGDEPVEKRETLTDLLQRSGRGLTLPDNSPPEDLPEAGTGGQVASTGAGFVDMRQLRRVPHPQTELASELVAYLRDRELDGVAVFEGSRPGYVLVDVATDNEATVFKAMHDCANALVQLREGSARSLAGLEVLMTASNGVRGAQFTLTPDLAQLLLSGSLKPEAFFLRYVEF